ncbi:MAG: hypothetical protein QNL62_04755 [Gammaproteobacteria bacterium]|nr:hypothetical protein [Gammaproteobacteria bacterium]
MKKINRIFKLIALSPLLFSHFVSASDEWTFFPVFTDDSWQSEASLSATAGYMDIGNSVAGGGATYGLQLAFNCPVFTIPGDNVILQQINLNFYDNNDLELTILEINPHYFWNVSDEVRFGVGPGLGYIWTDTNRGKDPDLWAGQAGFAIEYRKDSLYASFGSRYQWTESKTIGFKKDEDMDNLLTTIKVGYNF